MFELSTSSSRLALKKEFQNTKLTNVDADPDIWKLKVNIENEAFVDQKVSYGIWFWFEAIEKDMHKKEEDGITVKRVCEKIRARLRTMKLGLMKEALLTTRTKLHMSSHSSNLKDNMVSVENMGQE
jgi:hypothetical protein